MKLIVNTSGLYVDKRETMHGKIGPNSSSGEATDRNPVSGLYIPNYAIIRRLRSDHVIN